MTRRRYIVVEGELVELLREEDNARPTVPVIGDRHYDGQQTTDGVNISTRAKHRAYMREHGLTTVDDYTDHFQREADRRKRYFTEGYDPTRRRDIERAVQAVYEKGKR